MPLDAIAAALSAGVRVPGRFQPVDEGQPFAVLVDYAHTPDSLENVLRAARALTARSGGPLICVFGCGGDRDRGKRPQMGEIAARLADVAIVTSDNPRSEDPRRSSRRSSPASSARRRAVEARSSTAARRSAQAVERARAPATSS